MIRVLRRPTVSVLTTCWRTHAPIAAGLQWCPTPQPVCARLMSSGLLTDKQKLTFSPKDVEPGIVPAQPQLSVTDQPAVNEIDLTQFLVTEPSAGTAAASAVSEMIEKIGPVTSSDIGLTWWCPTGQSHSHVFMFQLTIILSQTGGMFHIFNYLHEMFPWWGTVAVATLIARLLMTPLVVYSQSQCPTRPAFFPLLT